MIDHFKAQHKRVVVVGYSYGSFLVARYLALHGPDGADRYLLMAGRLDMPADFVDGALAGMLYHFPDTVAAELSDRRRPRTRSRSSGALPARPFTTATRNDSPTPTCARRFYVYATADTVVGRLAEPKCVSSRTTGATVIAGEGANHYNLALNQAILDRIHDALQQQP